MKKKSQWFFQHRKTLILILVLALVAGLFGAGASVLRREAFLPRLSGNPCQLEVEENGIFCTLSRGKDNLLLHLAPDGTLLHHCRTGRDDYFESFCVSGTQIYAILNRCDYLEPKQGQFLVRMELDHPVMKPETLALLDVSQNIQWQSVTPEYPGTLLLAGVDPMGNGYTAEVSLEASKLENLQKKEEIQHAARVLRSGREELSWLILGQPEIPSDHGKLHLLQGMDLSEDLLRDMAVTPIRMTVCGESLFVRDSRTKELFEIDRTNNEVQCFREAADPVREEQTVENLLCETVYLDSQGEYRIAGMVRNGQDLSIVGEEWSIPEITEGQHCLSLYFRFAWPAALIVFLLLLALAFGLRGIFCSPRLSTRLLLCELAVALLMLTAVLGIQYKSYEEVVWKESKQQMELIAGTMSHALDQNRQMDDREIGQTILELWNANPISEKEENIDVQVLWNSEDGPIIGYDPQFPSGYLLEDTVNDGYFRTAELSLAYGVETFSSIKGKIADDYLYITPIAQGERQGCVVVRQEQDIWLTALYHFFNRMLMILLICLVLFLALLLITRRLMSPLDRIQSALEGFYSSGGGNQMQLDRMPRTELYEMGRVFNQLSTETKVQMNALHTVNDAYARIVPDGMLQLLDARNVSQLKPGKTSDGVYPILRIAFEPGKELPEALNKAVDLVGKHGGIVVDHDEQGITALFSEAKQALDCSHSCGELPVYTAILKESVQFGIFGGDHLLFPVALTERMDRRREVLTLLSGFGAKMILTGNGGIDQRLLGWDDGISFYEDVSAHSPEWVTLWREAEPIWTRAMQYYEYGVFNLAIRNFARVLRLMPEDRAARWYLFRCEALRDQKDGKKETGLLSEGKGSL